MTISDKARSPMEEALTKCAERFREYEASHNERAYSDSGLIYSPDRLEKAARNREMAEMCEAALSTKGEASELVKRLRARSKPIYAAAGQYEYVINTEPDALCHEAADEIERLQSLSVEKGIVEWLRIQETDEYELARHRSGVEIDKHFAASHAFKRAADAIERGVREGERG